MRQLNAEQALNLGKMIEHLCKHCTYVQIGMAFPGTDGMLITFKITKLSKDVMYTYIGAVTPNELDLIRDPKVLADAFLGRLRNKFNKAE